MTDTTAPTPLTPEARLRRPHAGPNVEVDGREWTLARPGLRLPREVRAVIDKLYNERSAYQSVHLADVNALAFLMLREANELADPETAALICQSDPDELIDAVFECLFAERALRRNWTDWARASLIANGLRPEEIPPDDLPHVLRILVRTKRTVPASEYTEADEAAQKVAGFHAIADYQARMRAQDRRPEPEADGAAAAPAEAMPGA